MVTIFIFLESKSSDVTYVVSSVDNRKYLVRNLPDKKQAADILANTRKKLVTLCDILEEKYSKNKSIIRLIRNFRPDNLIESDGGSKYTSYAVNKEKK